MRPSLLRSDYNTFRLYTLKHRDKLDPLDREWLARWEMFDLATSPRDDKERGLIRFGHYLGFLHAREVET